MVAPQYPHQIELPHAVLCDDHAEPMRATTVTAPGTEPISVTYVCSRDVDMCAAQYLVHVL